MAGAWVGCMNKKTFRSCVEWDPTNTRDIVLQMPNAEKQVDLMDEQWAVNY